jgi:hypothetical protein
MKYLSATVLGFLLLGFWHAAHAALPPAIAVAEINYLLDFIDRSGCQFYRNGRWYDAHRAKAHLRNKYDYLVAHDRVRTAEDFIEEAATKSGTSGKEYQIRCEGSSAVASSSWLGSALSAYRASAIQGTLPKASPTK